MQKSDPVLLERLGALEKSLKEKDEIITGFGAVAKNLERIFTGQRKSAHSVAVLNKPGTELAKSEGDIDVSALNHEQIVSKLNQITASGGLSKSDKDAVITYVSGTKKDPTKIAHLLTKKN
jgi:glutamate dehydrogenase/leucine dehydrogenase